jgi:replicative DNA helicase
MEAEKLPPHDIDAEENVIGSLLIDGEAIHQISSFLKPEDFYREKNQWCYQSCLSLYESDTAIDQITIAQDLARQQKLEALGGPAYLSHLVSTVPTSLHVEHYAQIVYRLSMMRKLIVAAGQVAAIGYEADPDVDGALGRAEDVLFRLRNAQSPRDFVHIKQVLDQYFAEGALTPQLSPEEAEHPQMILTGFAAVDDFLGGLQRSDMFILAARPSLGKTSLALSIAHNAAQNQKALVAIFSLEMGRESLVQRLLSAISGVDIHNLRQKKMTAVQESLVIDAEGTLAEVPIYIDDSPQLRMVELRSKARRLHFEKGIDLIIVDYLQLMQGDSRRTDNRVQEISEISRSLKGLARELNVPVLALSQMSRAVEFRASHRPQLSDLRESGSIEQDADVVVFIHREAFGTTEEQWRQQELNKPYPREVADLIIAKHRNGPIGEIRLRFIPETAKFENHIAQGEPSRL